MQVHKVHPDFPCFAQGIASNRQLHSHNRPYFDIHRLYVAISRQYFLQVLMLFHNYQAHPDYAPSLRKYYL